MPPKAERWWVIAESELKRAIQEARDGGDPDVVLLELYANSTVERPEDDDAESES